MGRKKKIQVSDPLQASTGYAQNAGAGFEPIPVPMVTDADVSYEARPKEDLGYLGLRSIGQPEEQTYIHLIRHGVSRQSLEHLMVRTGISVQEMAAILETTDRTLRRYGADDKLTREQSERAFEIARLYSRGEEVFGSAEAFKQWMNSPIPALGQQRPKSYLDTSLGIQILLGYLGRIEQGVFA
ncbi:MAG TPA: DUF2384 domain-containing protein [Phnomibacter sp.]|nr:DUF2384 domain-containing protein [Phnomibacter sp.]